MPAVAGDHPRETELHPEDHAVQVDVDRAPRGEVVLVEKPPDGHDPGVVDQHVERSELLFGGIEEAGEGVAVGDVQRQRNCARAELGGGLLGGGEIDVADRHPHPGRQEGLCGGTTDASRGPGDRGILTGDEAW